MQSIRSLNCDEFEIILNLFLSCFCVAMCPIPIVELVGAISHETTPGLSLPWEDNFVATFEENNTSIYMS